MATELDTVKITFGGAEFEVPRLLLEQHLELKKGMVGSDPMDVGVLVLRISLKGVAGALDRRPTLQEIETAALAVLQHNGYVKDPNAAAPLAAGQSS